MDVNGPRINLRLIGRTPLTRKGVAFWSNLAEEAWEAMVVYSVSTYINIFLKNIWPCKTQLLYSGSSWTSWFWGPLGYVHVWAWCPLSRGMVQVSRPQSCGIISAFSGTVLVVNKCSSCKAKGGLGNSTGHGPFLIDDIDKVVFLWGGNLRCRGASSSVTQPKMGWGKCALLVLLNRQVSSSEKSRPEHLSIWHGDSAVL